MQLTGDFFSPLRRRSSRRALRPVSMRALAVVCCAFLIPVPAMTQGVRGTVSGQVLDSSGAVVTGAQVRLVDVGKNQEVRSVRAGDDGRYQFLDVEPAVYDLVFSAAGFAELRYNAIKVEPNRNLQLDATLPAAGATEEVTVTASQELVERSAPTLGTTVDRRRVQDLPLNGRNVFNLTLLQPGVSPTPTGGFGSSLGFRVNGQRAVENNFQFDGSNNNEVAVGAPIGGTPRPDAVQEFRLLTSNYEAEFGRNTGAVINVVTRSGSSEFHGNARIFYRPTFLSAARFFDQNDPADRPFRNDDDFRRRFERKDYGANLGGPFVIPGLYDGRQRTFFFADYERRNQLIGDSRTITGLPTLAERNGDFSGLGRTLLDPATGLPFQGNRIPAERFSPIAQFYLGFLPTPGAGGAATAAADEVTNNHWGVVRVDHQISTRQVLNFTFNFFDTAQVEPFAFGGASVPGFGATDKRRTYNYVARHTYSFNPSIINTLTVAYGRNNQPSVAPENGTTPEEIGFTADFVANRDFAGPPRITLFDRNILLGNSIQGPQARVTENFQIQDAVSWARGAHRFKFGFDGVHHKHDQTFLFVNQGILTFSGNFGGNTTGDDFADLLIGNSPIAIQFGANGLRDFRQNAAAWFIQDTWRATPELTLSLGLRWEYTSPLTDKFNRVAYFRPGAVSTLLTTGQLRSFEGTPIVVPPGRRAPVGLVFPGDPDALLGGIVPDGGIEKDYNNFAPRFGFAYSPAHSNGMLGRLLGDRKTVIRGGFGVFYGSIIGDTVLQQLTAPGFNGTNAFFFPGSGTLADPFAPDPFPAFRGVQPQRPNPFLASQFFISAPLNQMAQPIDPFIRTPYTMQWNLTVERGFARDYVASLSYVGNAGRKLYAREQINPSVGTLIATPAGRVIPNPTPSNTNARRLNEDFQLGLPQLVSAANSSYHALQANLTKRFSNGLLFQAAYTFSKSITDTETQRGAIDLIDRRFGRSLSADDIPHRFVASYIYDLPGRNLDGWMGNLIGGWSVGGITTFQSGTPITVLNPFDTTGTGGAVLSFADVGAPFRNVDPRKNDARAFNADAFQAFGAPDAAGNFTVLRRGTSGANQVRVENGINNWDLFLMKRVRLASERVGLELRVEAFNAFNHTQFGPAPNATTDLTGVDLNIQSLTFGKFVSARESRVLQLGARITF